MNINSALSYYYTANEACVPDGMYWIYLSRCDSSNLLFFLFWLSFLRYYISTMTGPHFDYTFFITATGIVGSIMSLFSVLLFQRFFSTWRFRPAIVMTLVIGALASMIDVIIMKVGDFHLFYTRVSHVLYIHHSSLPFIPPSFSVGIWRCWAFLIKSSSCVVEQFLVV